MITLQYGRGSVTLLMRGWPESTIVQPGAFSTLVPSPELGVMPDTGYEESLRAFLRGKKNVTLIVPDKTRKAALPLVLPGIIRILEEGGYERGELKLLFALGTHHPLTPNEQSDLLSKEIYDRLHPQNHDPHALDGLRLGETKRGTPVVLNRHAALADGIIAIGPVMHHYFAGFGGGPKLIVPGVAGHATITANHRLTLMNDGVFNPHCTEGRLDGNPVYEDIVEAVRFCPPAWLLGYILDDDARFHYAQAGDIIEVHKAIAMKAAAYEVDVPAPADLVIVSAGGYPRDITFIQTHKALHHACAIVREGGVVVCLAACEEGIGSSTFLPWFRFGSSRELSRELIREYTLNGHTALALRRKTEHATIILVSALPRDHVSAMGMVPACSLEEALRLARKFQPSIASVHVLPRGAMTVPRCAISPETMHPSIAKDMS